MDIRRFDNTTEVRPLTQQLLGRVFSPLCGLSTMIGFVLNSGGDPRFMVAGGELTNVLALGDTPRARRGSYHIGGSGVFRDEPLIKCIGETVERYSQVASELALGGEVRIETYDRLPDDGPARLDLRCFELYAEDQLARPGFPFSAFDPSEPLGWLSVRSLIDNGETWAPAQLLLIGYAIRRHLGERWISSSMTTGTAAHTSRELALRNALLELIQIDSVVGHWYGRGVCHEVRLDARTEVIAGLLKAQFASATAAAKFYWLPNPDLPGFTIVCVISSHDGRLPARAAGIGIALTLNEAIYKALMETVGVFQLAKLSLVNQEQEAGTAKAIDPAAIYNLDDNVRWYAWPQNVAPLDARYRAGSPVAASQLPADVRKGADDEIEYLIGAFANSGKRLYQMDLTLPDVAQLGFSSARVWSPDTLSLCLPSAPPKRHARFEAYGGFAHDLPHPYP